MTMITRRRFATGLAAGTGALLAAPGLLRAAATVGENGLHAQSWFHEGFLEMRGDLDEAAADGKLLAVIFEQRGCPYCREMHTVNLERPEIVDYIREKFLVVQLDMWGSRGVTDFDGKVLEERELARRWRVNFTPTISFFDREGYQDGQSGLEAEVARLPGYFKPFHFLSMFEYVADRHYKDQAFQRFLQDRFARLQAQGIDPDVW